MRRIKYLLIAVLLIVVSLPTNVSASGSVRVTNTNGNGNLIIHESDKNGMIEGTISTTGGVSASTGKIQIMSNSHSVSYKVSSKGTISFNGFTLDSDLKKTPINQTFTIDLPAPKPKPSTPNKPNSGNTNSGNTNNKPSKIPEQIAAEKKAAEEAAKKAKEEAEKLEKEKIEKTPLFKEIEVISLDQVLHGQNVGTIKAEFDKNSYEFTLPKYVNKYKLQVNTDESGVEFVFDEEHDFTNSKDVSKTIDLRAVKGDLSQNFTIKLNKNTDVDAVRKHEDKEYNVFSSDKLEEFMKARGYVKKEHDVDGVKSYYFEKDKLKVQLLFDDKLNGKWFILDDKLEFGNEVILIDLKNDLFFVDEAPEELAKKSIEENKYSEKTIDYASLYSDIHQGLVMNNKYKSWELEDTGEIVYGIKSDGVEGTYLLAGKLPSDAKVEKAFISFGSHDSKYQKISWALGGTLFALIGTGGFLQLSKKKKED